MLSDTDPRAMEVWLGLLRQMTPEDKIRRVFEVTQLVLELQKVGVRQHYPQADEREVFLRAAARRYDRDTMIRVWGFDPDRK